MKSIQITNANISELHDKLDIALAASKEYQVSITVFDNSLGARMTALANIWYSTINSEMGEIDFAKAYSKYWFGLKIRCREDKDLREIVRRMLPTNDDEKNIAIIRAYDDWFPVLSKMTVDEKSEYLNVMQVHFAERGIILTSPNEVELLNCREANQ